MNWGWLFFAAFVEAVVTYVAFHWDADWKPLVTLFTIGTAFPFIVILVYGFIRIETNPANAVAIGTDTIAATVKAFVDAVPSAVAGDIAGIVVGGVFVLFTGRN